MLGASPISAILGSGVRGDDHVAVRSYIREACKAGLALLVIYPGSKMPFDGRSLPKRRKDDKAAQDEAREAGRPDWAKVKSPSGLALASSDSKTVLGYLDRYIEKFGDDVWVNLAVEVGASRLVVVDCDTDAQRENFLRVGNGPDDLPPTIVSPGSQDDKGVWLHEPGNGHYWFTVPDGVELPTNVGALTWGGNDGFAVLWHRRYVLIPPSRRAEGAYELLGREYECPDFLIDAIMERGQSRTARTAEMAEDSELKGSIDEWAESRSWASILEPLGWTPTARPDGCGCEVWTAPGNHSSPKSATAHDSGCSLGRYTETNAPLHIWTDHDIEPFDAYIAATDGKSKTLSKLQAVAYADYDGNVGKAMDGLDLGVALTTIERDMGTSPKNMVDPATSNDVGEAFDLPEHEKTPPDRTNGVGDDDDSADSDSPFDEPTNPDPDVFEPGVYGLPMIAPFSHWRDMPPPEYVIEGLIEHGGLSSIIGPAGVGKSSVTLDMACHIAVGRPWQGRKTLKTRVLYLPGEGLSGAVQRVKAWAHENDVPEEILDDGIRMGNSIIQLGAPSEAWGMLAEYVIRQRIGLIVFDTFARMSLGIEENSATEVGKAVVRFDHMRRLTNAGVLIVHHTGKGNPTSARGSSALNAALDSELLVSEASWTFDQLGLNDENGRPPAGKPIQLTTTKQKNAEQLEHPIPLLMRSCDTFDAPYITGPNGHVDPMMGEVVLARPVDEPIVETAIRIARFVDTLPEQGATRSDIVSGVLPDPYTQSRRDAPKAWKQKVAVAVDLGLRYLLLETASGQRLGARYVRGPSTIEQARVSHAASVMGDDDA